MRLPLLTALAAAAAATAAAPLAAQPRLTPHQQLAREVYEELVEINTVDDSVGSTTRAAEAMAARFRAAGFPAADVRVLVPDGHPRKGNLVVRYRGRGAPNAGKPILLLAHLDVVAARREDWPRDPFTLYEENGYFLGRGTADDKAMAAIFVANVLRYKREGWAPERDLILALTADEEGGPINGVSWLVEKHRPLIDAAYAINEGGGGTLTADGKPLLHSVQAAEKVYSDYTFTATNTGGHSSVPRADNAIYALGDALARVARFRFPVALNPVTRGFFEQTAKVEPRADMAAAMRALVATPASAGVTSIDSAAATLSRDDRYASMLRTTCVATMLRGGHAPNALPQRAEANVNCRIVPTSGSAETLAILRRVVADTAVAVTLADTARVGTPPSAIEPGLLAATTALTKSMFGANVPVIPTMSTGATDGYRLRLAGIPTFGVSGLFSVPGETNAHGRDEKMRVKSFYDGLEFLDQLVRRVAGSPRM
jgi:acetylornithine deacetylase/succinyl-diaminopimelate desuccinylase-like protein